MAYKKLSSFAAKTDLSGQEYVILAGDIKIQINVLAQLIAPFVPGGQNGYIPVSTFVLPTLPANEVRFSIVKAGTYTKPEGGTLVLTERLNVINHAAGAWSLGNAVPVLDGSQIINKPTGTVLPNPIGTASAFMFVPGGLVLTQTTGGSITTVEKLNLILWSSNGTTGTWTMGLAITIPTGAVAWTATIFKNTDQTIYAGKLWKANSDTIATDVPGVSDKWDELLTAYASVSAATINLLDTNSLVLGTISTGTGNDVVSSTFSRSGYIKIKPSTAYSLWRTVNYLVSRGSSVGNVVAFYTSAKTWISPVYTNNINTALLTSPANAAYMRIAINSVTDDVLKLIMLIEGDTQPDKLYKFGTPLSKAVVLQKENLEYGITEAFAAVLSSLQRTTGGITQKMMSYLTKTTNLFDVNGTTIGAINTTTGANISDATYIRTDFLEAKPLTDYSVWDTLPIIKRINISGTSLFFYDINKIFLGGTVAGAPNTGLVNSPANTAYVRLIVKRIDNTINAGLMLIETDVQPTKFIPYGYYANADFQLSIKNLEQGLRDSVDFLALILSGKVNWVLPENAIFLKLGVNLYNGLNIVPGKSLNTTTGNEATSTGFSATPFIPVEFGKNYVTTRGTDAVIMSTWTFGVWYKKDKTYHSAASSVGGGVYTPPDNTVGYFRGSTQDASFTYLMFIEGTTTPTRYTKWGYEPNPNYFRIPPVYGDWFDLFAIFCGDSFTAQGKYIQPLLEVTGLKLAYNFGLTGQLLKTMADNLTVENLANVSIVFFMGGTNDVGHGSATLGTVNDTKDMNTIAGVMAYLVDKTLTLKPSVRIVFITQPYRGYYTGEPTYNPPGPNGNGLTTENVSRMLVDKGHALGVFVIDLYSRLGVNAYNISSMTDDGLHPNTPLGIRIGRTAGKIVNTLSI